MNRMYPAKPPETANPDDPTSMALPVIGDRVLLHDGTQAIVDSRHRYQDGDGRVRRWKVNPVDGSAPRQVTLDEIAGYPEGEPEPTSPAGGGVLSLEPITERGLQAVIEVGSRASSQAGLAGIRPALVQLDHADAAARALDVLLEWEEIYHGRVQPGENLIGLVDRLADAARDYRQAVAR
ncbi:hypothetical protein GCM10027059_26950 [Myceligenerans halotolerans]